LRRTIPAGSPYPSIWGGGFAVGRIKRE